MPRERRRAERLADELQGAVCRERADLAAVAPILRMLDARRSGTSEREPYGADGLFGRAAVRTRDSGDRGRPGGAGGTARAFRHRASDGLADGAVRAQDLRGNAERPFLQRIGVDDERTGGPARAARRFREELGDETTGAAFRAADRLAARRQLFADRLRERHAVGAVDERREDVAAFRLDDGERSRRAFL